MVPGAGVGPALVWLNPEPMTPVLRAAGEDARWPALNMVLLTEMGYNAGPSARSESVGDVNIA